MLQQALNYFVMSFTVDINLSQPTFIWQNAFKWKPTNKKNFNAIK